jgi:hypothetical protein
MDPHSVEKRTVVAVFGDREAAQRAADALVASGVAAERVHLHEHGAPPRNSAGIVADEYLTGGFFSNFVHLFNDLLGSPLPERTAASYADVVAYEGAAVSVEANDAAQAALVEKTLKQAEALKVAGSQG